MSGTEERAYKEAFIVTGPESSGSRFIHNLLQASTRDGTTCAGVVYTWKFPHDGRDNEIFKEEDNFQGIKDCKTDLVIHRSVPDGAHKIGPENPLDDMFPDLEAFFAACKEAGYKTHLVVCVRDHYAIMESQVTRNMSTDLKDAVNRMRVAYEYIYRVSPLADTSLTVSYDSLCVRDAAPQVFIELFGREFNPVEVRDGTAKYY